ncbi:NAD(P)-binding protein [Annulohypoxylon maeteangense]|uniref:NAD(P)-binding protein n=1 Tax=Annulohypoxylon maeteangense TaxID=1927788 RepID=UPI0020086576|nr:NAD(P)-binding protein [Annulohypoxylon maeteangense]KAI0886186.1 NAD(P)-binding protein [Annulohypoxylon maeteangense]
MVKLDVVRVANAALADGTRTFTAVVTGGTAGIGKATVRAIATTFASRGSRDERRGFLRVHIVGRNREAAGKIIAECEAACPGGIFRFHGGDLSLLKEVDRICSEIIEIERREADAPAKIDFLVCCQGVLSLTPEESNEGLDKYFSLYYYSRMRLMDRFLPLLTASPNGGHVVSVFNSSVQASVVLDDLTLRSPRNQALRGRFAHWVGMTNIFMEELVRRNPGRLSLCHYHPGFVPTDIAKNSNLPWYLKFLVTYIATPLLWPFLVPFEECGQRVLFMASPAIFPVQVSKDKETATGLVKDVEAAIGIDGKVGSGVYLVTKDNDTFGKEKKYAELRANGTAEKIYQHTMAVFAKIEASGVYTD